MTDESPEDLITALQYHLAARNVAPETVTHYTTALVRFLKWSPRPLGLVGRAELERYFAGLAEQGLAAATLRWHFAGLRAALKWWAGREGRQSPMAGMSAPKVRETVKDIVGPEDVKKLLGWLREYKLYRDAAAIALLFDVGLRASELCALDWPDVNWKEGVIAVGTGRQTKNGDVRMVPLNPVAGEFLDLWKARRPNKKESWIFGDTRPGRSGRLSRSGLLNMVKRDFKLIGIENISPHDLRHSFATTYMDREESQTVDLMAVGGWKSESMVRRYSRAGRERRAIREFRKHSPLS